MKCLILAAGRAEGPAITGRPRPPLPGMGLPLLEGAIRTAHGAGLRELVVVTGHRAGVVEGFLSDLSLRMGVPISTVRNEDWGKGNGLSLLKARQAIREDFVLLMPDRVLDEAILRRMLEEDPGEDSIVLAVDFRVEENELIDSEDAGKVLVREGRIQDIGKGIESYNAYDTGACLCSVSFFDAMERSTLEGDGSLSGCVRRVAGAGKARALDIGDAYWIDVAPPTVPRRARRPLRRTMVEAGEDLVFRWMKRKVSLRLLPPLLLRLPPSIPPNRLSGLSFLVAIAAAACFFLGGPVIGGILLLLASILDGWDGEIARIKRIRPRPRCLLDAVLDGYADAFVLFGMLHHALAARGNLDLLGEHGAPITTAVFLTAITGQLMVSNTSWRMATDLGDRYKRPLVGAAQGRDVRLFVLFLGGILTGVHPASVTAAALFIAILTNGVVVGRTVTSRRTARLAASLDLENTRAVIFDFDGTVADTMPFLEGLAVDLLTSHYGLSRDEATRRYRETTGLPFASQMELNFPHDPRNRRVVETFEARKLKGIFACAVFADVVPCLESLRRAGIRRFVSSSTRHETVSRFARMRGIDALLDGCYGHEADRGKGRQIDAILERQGLSPGETLFVGDSLKDHEFARDRGLRFVGLTRMFTRRDFGRKGSFSIPDLSALTRLFEMTRSAARPLDGRR